MSLFTLYAWSFNPGTGGTASYDLLGILPVSGQLTASRTLNDAGALSASITVPQVDTWGNNIPTDEQLVGWSAVNRIALVLEGQIGGKPLWCGLLTQRNRKSTRMWDLSGAEHLDYFNRRVLAGNYTGTWDFATLAEQMLTDAQAVTNGDVGLQVPANTAGQTFSASYLEDQWQTVLSAIQDITSTAYMEMRHSVTYSAGNLLPAVDVGVPLCGRPYSATGFVINMLTVPDPGYEWVEDGTKQGNRIVETGSSTGSSNAQRVAFAQDSTASASGYPLLEQVESRQYVASQTFLQDAANADLVLYDGPVVTATIPIPTFGHIYGLDRGANFSYGDYELGDEIRMMNSGDHQFPAGIDMMLRIVADSTVVPAGAGPAVTTLTLNSVPAFAPAGW